MEENIIFKRKSSLDLRENNEIFLLSGGISFNFNQYDLTDLNMEKLKIENKNLNSMLETLNFPSIGDLTINDEKQIKKTIKCVYLLIQEKQKENELKNKFYENFLQLENEKKKTRDFY